MLILSDHADHACEVSRVRAAIVTERDRIGITRMRMKMKMATLIWISSAIWRQQQRILDVKRDLPQQPQECVPTTALRGMYVWLES